MDNSLLLEQLKKIDGLQLNPHKKSDLVNGECTIRNSSSRRKNVIGDINPNGRSFSLYKDGRWQSRKRLGIQTTDQVIDWVLKDMEHLKSKTSVK